jgi:hypothetical protein
MNSIFDMNEAPLSEAELEGVRQHAKGVIDLWRRRTLYSGSVFFLVCACVVPFLAGHSLHSYSDSFGKYLIFLSMGLLPVFVYCGAAWWNSWAVLRDMTKMPSPRLR